MSVRDYWQFHELRVDIRSKLSKNFHLSLFFYKLIWKFNFFGAEKKIWKKMLLAGLLREIKIKFSLFFSKIYNPVCGLRITGEVHDRSSRTCVCLLHSGWFRAYSLENVGPTADDDLMITHSCVYSICTRSQFSTLDTNVFLSIFCVSPHHQSSSYPPSLKFYKEMMAIKLYR